jgi:acetyl esterase/lipase
MTSKDFHRINLDARDPLLKFLASTQGGLGAYKDLYQRRKIHDAMAQILPEALDLNIIEREIAIEKDSKLRVRIYSKKDLEQAAPAMLYIHGGGMSLGNLENEDLVARRFAREFNIRVVAVEYRLAPEFRFPIPVEDCYAALSWMVLNADALKINPEMIILYGGSAGGGLAIATMLYARDHGAPKVSFVMAPYPMIDYKHNQPSTHDITDIGIWDREIGLDAWGLYLGEQINDVEISPYASPSYANDLSNLPPVFIDVGELDTLRDESIAFIIRLIAAANTVEFHLYPGVYHATELFAPDAQISQQIWRNRFNALSRFLNQDVKEL